MPSLGQALPFEARHDPAGYPEPFSSGRCRYRVRRRDDGLEHESHRPRKPYGPVRNSTYDDPREHYLADRKKPYGSRRLACNSRSEEKNAAE